MLKLLTLLVFKLKIFNGDSGTAKKILDLMNLSHTQKGKNKVPGYQIEKNNEMILTRKIILKYKIMIIRHKISFIAAQHGITIKELILRQILKTNEALRNDGIVYTDKGKQDSEIKVLEAIVNTAKPLSEAVKPLKEQTELKKSLSRRQADEVNLKEFLQRMRRKRAV